MNKLICGLLCSALVLLSGCSLLPARTIPEEPRWSLAEVPADTAFTTSTMRVTAPAGTPENAALAVVLFDEVTGNPYNSHTITLAPQGNGTWSTDLTLPAGSVLRYRYVRTSPSFAEETTASHRAVDYRLAYFPGANEISDHIAGWTDQGYSGETGRILGRVLDSATGLPLADRLVAVAGEHTFTDGLGSFQFDQLAPGLQNILILSMDGAYQPAQQGAVVAGNSLTPAEMSLQPAAITQVTFEVTLPEGTPAELPLRLAGNLTQFGQTFYRLSGDTSTSSTAMAGLIRIDETHAILLANLYEGSDLHYKYTLGDGLWNAERDADGYFRLRQAIVTPDLILRDTVESWYGEHQGTVHFTVTPPASTDPDALITLQLNPFSWFHPLPMQRLENGRWEFTLLNPLDFSAPVGYRYCLNFSCSNENLPAALLEAGAGEFLPQDTTQSFSDQVTSWGWGLQEAVTPIAMPEISPQPSYETGLELLPGSNPGWLQQIEALSRTAAGMHSSAITFTPAWMATRTAPTPLIQFDPAFSPFRAELAAAIQLAKDNGLQTSLRPIVTAAGGMESWWQEAPRDWAWWNVWFDRYRSLVLTYAHLAAETSVDRMILGGEAFPAFPDGILQDGSASQAPADAEARWLTLIDEVRSIYDGKIAFEFRYAPEGNPPGFLDGTDEIMVQWNVPLTDSTSAPPAELQQNAVSHASTLVSMLSPYAGKPVLVSFAYPSVDGGASSCIAGNESACLTPDAFANGSEIAGSPPVDFSEQMEALHAMMLAVYRFEEIEGVFLNNINPSAALPDKSASILGKPAQEVAAAWFTRIR